MSTLKSKSEIKLDPRIEGVRCAYTKVIWEICKETRRANKVLPGSKLADHCLAVFELCRENGVALTTYMSLGVSHYSPGWCKRAFGTYYPPFNIIVSEKERGRVRKVTMKAEQSGSIASRVALYFHMLDDIDKGAARALVGAGFCQEKAVAKLVLRRLNENHK